MKNLIDTLRDRGGKVEFAEEKIQQAYTKLIEERKVVQLEGWIDFFGVKQDPSIVKHAYSEYF